MDKVKKLFFSEIIDNNRHILLFVIFCALATRSMAMVLTDNYLGGDPLSRVQAALILFKNHSLCPPCGERLPLHFYLIGLSLLIWNNIIISPRLVSLVFGVATVVPFYCFIYLDFGKEVAKYSSLLLAFFPLHVILSVVSLSEAPFIFFLIASLFFLKRYSVDRKISFIFIASILLACSIMIRYEGWLLIFPVALYIISIKKDKKQSLLTLVMYLSIVLMFPLLWMLWQYRFLGNPVNFAVSNIVFRIPHENWGAFQNIFDRLAYWFKRLYVDFGLCATIFAISGMVVSIIKRKNLLVIFLFFVLFFFLIFGVMTSTVAPHYEYLSIAEIFLLPFIISGIAHIVKSDKRIILSIVAIACLVSFWILLEERLKGHHIDNDVKLIAKYLKENAKKEDFILINETLQLSDIMITYGNLNSNKCYVTFLNNIEKKRDEIEKFIKEKKPKFIIYSNGEDLPLIFEDNRERIGNFNSFTRVVCSAGDYKIYRIYYQ